MNTSCSGCDWLMRNKDGEELGCVCPVVCIDGTQYKNTELDKIVNKFIAEHNSTLRKLYNG